VAFADESDVAALLVPSTQLHARVVTESEVQAVVELAMAAADDPNAEILAALDAEGLHAELIEGVLGDRRRLPHAAAGRGAGRHFDHQPVRRARHATPKKSTVLLWRDSTLAMAESTVPRWRILPDRPSRPTPQSKFGRLATDCPPHRDIHPLVPAPEQVHGRWPEQAGVQCPRCLLAALRWTQMIAVRFQPDTMPSCAG